MTARDLTITKRERAQVSNVVELPNRNKITVVFYEVSDPQNIAVWGGESPREALDWYRRSPAGSKIWVSQYEADEEEARLVLDLIEITPIVLATIADSIDRWSK
jgi:hypothetical protein